MVPMTFLNPMMLLFGLVTAIPIVLHIWNRKTDDQRSMGRFAIPGRSNSRFISPHSPGTRLAAGNSMCHYRHLGNRIGSSDLFRHSGGAR